MTVRRRAMPAVLTLLSLLLDTSVIPFLISSPYIVSLTFSTVLVLGVYLGRMHGMLYGLIAGLLQDILVGYQLGFNTFVYIALGFTPALSPMSRRRCAHASGLRAFICAGRLRS